MLNIIVLVFCFALAQSLPPSARARGAFMHSLGAMARASSLQMAATVSSSSPRTKLPSISASPGEVSEFLALYPAALADMFRGVNGRDLYGITESDINTLLRGIDGHAHYQGLAMVRLLHPPGNYYTRILLFSILVPCLSSA
jgi:hypothetical protein